MKKSIQTLILMMTTDYFRNYGQGLTFTLSLYCKYINRYIIYSAKNINMFLPGTIHAVYKDEDFVFSGGYFLTPQIMNRFLRLLGQKEFDFSRTNDSKSVDFFQIRKISYLNLSGRQLQTSQGHSFMNIYWQLRIIFSWPFLQNHQIGMIKPIWIAKSSLKKRQSKRNG